ncbi:unnamed protein product [Trifolium pratense]|uniref:Uncharacterized protein n=1 Tax=Trifolium pratense TaxID=57577 RepID=A0ACB0L7X1_TRIPR|nr:unnamed protein product [Trifolium pratense]
MPTYYEDISLYLGSRIQKSITYTVHVNGVPYGEIDPSFAQQYSHELDDQWKFFCCNYMYLVTWNRDVNQPRLTNGWTEIREHLDLQNHYHLFGLEYYGDSMFHLVLNPTRDSSTYGLPSFHSLSAKPNDSLSFDVAIPSDPNSTIQLILNQELGEYITSYHNSLLLEGPVAEPMLSPIIKLVDQDQVTTYEVDSWPIFCRENYFSHGDIVKFTFFDLENSNRVDVDWISH